MTDEYKITITILVLDVLVVLWCGVSGANAVVEGAGSIDVQCESKKSPPRGPDILKIYFFSQTVENL